MEAKKIAAEKAVELIRDGMTIGLGTGSTAFYAIKKIGELVKEGLKIKCVATSVQSETLALGLRIPIVPVSAVDFVDITIDGADEADSKKNLIKGGGGALLREKIIAFHSRQFYVIIDESKRVNKLGNFPLPVEIVSFGSDLTLRQLHLLGCEPAIRKSTNEKLITDNGNYIADCKFSVPIDDPEGLNAKIKTIPGVVETGLFLHSMVTAIIVGYNNGEIKVM